MRKYRKLGDLGEQTGGVAASRQATRAVACDDSGFWYLASEMRIQVFSPELEPVRQWPTVSAVWSVVVDPSGRIWAGGESQIDIYSADGTHEDSWRDRELLGLATALAVTTDSVFVADARARWIHHLDRDGRLVNHIGDHHRKGGFHIPNGILDFALDRDGTLVVANPGMHRVERYRPDGESLGYFGRFGQRDPAGFPGCCNPTNLALGLTGDIVVSEKAGPRVKVYDAEGRLLSVVTAAADFDPSCKNMDLAVDGNGRIGVVDPVARLLVLYEPVDVARPAAVEGKGS